MTIRNQIIEKAKKLFNEKGSYKVSLREIAKAAGTTIGNLTYHFPTKDDLIASLQTDLYNDFTNNYINHLNGSETLFELLNSFKTINANRLENQFLFRNVIELSHESPTITNNGEIFRRRVYYYYHSLFIKLKEHGIMRSDLSYENYASLSYIIVYLTHLWIQNSTLYYDQVIPRIELHHALKDLVYPYLTNKGINLFNDFYSIPNN